MGKTMKKILCTLLVIVMCMTSAPLQGLVGMESNTLSLSAGAADAIFNLTKVLVEGTTYKISWQDISNNNLLGYKVYRINKDGSDKHLGSRVTSSTNEYIFYDTPSYDDGYGLEYSYRIEAWYKDGSSNSYYTDDGSISYKVGDIIQFGSYPQTEVKDESIISKLNSLAPEWDEWTSYGYYSGDGNYGSMVQGDWMRYTDVLHNGNKYRGVKFIQYRPSYTCFPASSKFSDQYKNGYYAGCVYWFKFEPIKWRILDPNKGLILCENIIDSQAYSNTVYLNYLNEEYYSDPQYTTQILNYDMSSIKLWLNYNFYNTAFNNNEKVAISNTNMDDDGYHFKINVSNFDLLNTESNNKLFFLSQTEVANSQYGFDSYVSAPDISRKATGTDYAKNQGLWVINEYSYWFLHSFYEYGYAANVVADTGTSTAGTPAWNCDMGVRPALILKDIATATQKASSYFMVSSDIYSVDSIHRKGTATYKINLLDTNSDFLPIDDVTVQNNTTDIVNITTNKVSDTELELTVEPIKDGDASISLFNGDGCVEQFFNFTVYSNTTTYRADQVPVTNEKLKTNFSRGDMTVDNFEYIFDENKGKYIATMDVYNRSGAIGVVAAYTQDGLISDIEQVDPYVPLPGDFGEFLVYLGTGAVSILKGENWNYRYSGYCQKTPIEIEVPEDGYLTVSCDISADEAVLIYNTVSLGVKTAFKTAEIIDYLGTDTDELAKEASKTIVRKTSEYFKSKKGKDWVGKALSKISKKMSKQFSVAYLEEMSMLSFDMLEEICQNVGTDFSTLFFEVIDELIQEEIKSFGVMSVSKKLIKEKVIGVAERNLMKVASAIFEGGEYINFANELLGTYLYNTDTGKTMIVFKPKGEDGFICKDTIKVTSDIITDEVLLHTYVIKDTQKADAFIRGRVHPYFNRNDGLDDREVSIDLNRIVEIHEISLWKNGQEVFDTFTATVEMNLPSYIDRRTCSIYRVEKDGTYTKLDTRIEGDKIIFETNHFSEYILTGVIEDLQETTHCDVHVYDEVRTEPSCTEEGSITYTCYCGDTYTETIEANGHIDSEWVVDKDSTCSVEGSKHIECTVCEEVLKTEPIVKLPHKYSSVITEATCETGGYTTYTCTCGDTYTGDKTSAKGHDYAEGICKNCGDSKIDNCSCNCHKSGFMGFIWKIILFFQKLFKTNKICACGIAHY